jgi:hypothetical protein
MVFETLKKGQTMKSRIFLPSAILTAAILLACPPNHDRGPAAIPAIVAQACAADEPSPGDVERAKQLFRRQQSGETLTPDEQEFLDRTRREFQRSRQARQRQGGNGPVSTTPVCDPKVVAALVPLDELSGSYKGEDGGLYGLGRNAPPAVHQAAYLAESQKIRPLDASGQPADDGKIVLLSIGMSNTTMEYSQFKQTAAADSRTSPHVLLVDGAQGGRIASVWARGLDGVPPGIKKAALKNADPWPVVDQRLRDAGATSQQVQAAWIKHANARPAAQGEFPKHAEILKEDVILTLEKLHQRFPNLRVAYLSSRIFGGYATTPLNPEPYAYEEAFAMRWVIRDQVQGDPRLNFDPARGAVKAPIVVWGPYLWANGVKPRKSDGLVWNPDDLVATDHTHPSPSGRQKVADLLLKFFTSDAGSRRWFVGR